MGVAGNVLEGTRQVRGESLHRFDSNFRPDPDARPHLHRPPLLEGKCQKQGRRGERLIELGYDDVRIESRDRKHAAIRQWIKSCSFRNVERINVG